MDELVRILRGDALAKSPPQQKRARGITIDSKEVQSSLSFIMIRVQLPSSFLMGLLFLNAGNKIELAADKIIHFHSFTPQVC